MSLPIMTGKPRDPWLLTPGPLTTSSTVKEAMLHDWGSRDHQFIETNRQMRNKLVSLAGGQGTHVCVPMQGSGTFAVEAMLGTLVGASDKALVLVNGAYGTRMAKIFDYYGRDYDVLQWPEDTPINPQEVDERLRSDTAISHVIAVHCETTSGILNPVQEVARVVAERGRRFLVDAMSAFGAVELDVKAVAVDAVAASSNKCIEGVPGMGFVIVRESVLEVTKGNAPSLSLDLYDQWVTMEKNAQWRFTPPTHVIVAFEQALREHEAEGGVAGRGGRYRENCKILVDGMRALGFETLLPDELQAPIIVTFHMPADPRFDFQQFYDSLNHQGYVIYPGKLTVAPSFRVGCIGRLGGDEIRGALRAIEQTITQMGVTQCGSVANAVAN